MFTYDITRKRTVTERFRVIAETDEEALRLVNLSDEGPEQVELVETSTHNSRLFIHGVEEL